jgi:hypothetical protein
MSLLRSAGATPAVARTRGQLLRFSLMAILLFGSFAPRSGYALVQACVGDCDGNGTVEIGELILGVNILLGTRDLSECPSLDNGSGQVTVARLIIAVNDALCGCGAGCIATTPGPATPTVTGPATEPTATPTEVASVSTWVVNNYDVAHSNCFSLLEGAVEGSLRAVGSQFTVRESGNRAEIDYGDNNVIVGTVDPDGTVHAQEHSHGSAGPCDYHIAVTASANLSNSPATATYDANVTLSGFCLSLSDCKMEITSQWTRVDNGTAND